MSEKNRFNLIDEPWIPVVDVGRASLRQIFTHPEYRALGGNPVQKIAITKLLLAIAQAAATPEDDDAWSALGPDGMAKACMDYLEQWYDRFWLYGDRPFLQVKNLSTYKEQPVGALIQGVSTGNTTVLNQSQIQSIILDDEWAMVVLVDQNFSVKHNLAYGAMTKPGAKGKGKATASGPSLGPSSYLHNFILGKSLMQSIWFNHLTKEMVDRLPFEYKHDQSRPVWEVDVPNRDSEHAKILTNSYIGRLCPLSRFIERFDDSIKYSEGLIYPSHKDGGREVSVAYRISDKGETFSINADPEMRPWRQLPSLLSFFVDMSSHNTTCYQLLLCLSHGRVRKHSDCFGIWSGGIRMSGDSYSQFAKSEDDYVESAIWLSNDIYSDPGLFVNKIEAEINGLSQVSKTLKKSVYRYFELQKNDDKEKKGNKNNMASALADQSISVFWSSCDRHFQELINACSLSNSIHYIRSRFHNIALEVFDNFCPHDTARQLEAWAKCRPNLVDYLNQGEST